MRSDISWSGVGCAVSPVLFSFLLLLGMKLAGVIGWSWWWVTVPLWGGGLGVLIGLMFVLVVAAISAVTEKDEW